MKPKEVSDKTALATRATQLAVIAALIDGKATDAELKVISDEVQKEFGTSVKEVKDRADKLLKKHEVIKLFGNPVAVVRRGLLAMRGLSEENKGKMKKVVDRVITADGKTADVELESFPRGVPVDGYVFGYPVRQRVRSRGAVSSNRNISEL